MSNPANVVQFEGAKVPSLQMNETELMGVLRNSLYPGAKDESIKMVIGWCRAQQKDPLKRPVHIVPMSVKVPGTDKYEWRDVLMPGIGDYRTDAARTGQYAGIGQAVFGPDKILELGEFKFSYPEWCEISVYRMVGSQRCEFSSGKVYWLECYSTAGKDSKAPNAMWKKRPRGQLEKCAEAMALRRAFPEVGSLPTADEMEGKTLDEPIDITPTKPAVEGVQSKSEKREAQTFDQPAGDKPPAEKAADKPAEGSTTSKPMADGQKRILRAKMANAGLTDIDLKAKFGMGLDDPEAAWTFDHFAAVQDWVIERQNNNA